MILAKALVLGVATFVVTLLALAGTAVLAGPQLEPLKPELADRAIWVGVLGGAGATALTGLLGLGIGTIIRTSVGSISVAGGLLLAVPLALQIVGAVTRSQGALDAAALLPGNLGARLYAYPATSPAASPDSAQAIALEPWQALTALPIWTGITLISGLILLRKRDVRALLISTTITRRENVERESDLHTVAGLLTASSPTPYPGERQTAGQSQPRRRPARELFA